MFNSLPPSRAPRWALIVEGWIKKHAYVGFVDIPAKRCALKSFVISNIQRKILLIYCLINIYLNNSQNHFIKLCSLNLFSLIYPKMHLKQQHIFFIIKM